MAREPSARVVLNRQAMSAVDLAISDGLASVGHAILEAADPPDATPYGEGLVDRGGLLVYFKGKKLDGFGLDGRQPAKPRQIRVRLEQLIQLIVGFGFPARFQEFGTVHHRAQPFLTPAMQQVVPKVASIMSPVVRRALQRIP